MEKHLLVRLIPQRSNLLTTWNSPDGDFEKGEKYVLDNFQWTKEMDVMAEKIKKVSKSLNGKVEEPLAEKLLQS